MSYFTDTDNGEKKRPFFISEIGLNHNGDVSVAEKMIIESAGAGAHAVKFQTFIPELMNSVFTKDLLENDSDTVPDTSIIDFLKQFILKEKDLRHLKSVAESEGVIFFSAPFDIESLDLLMNMGVDILKVASGEITNVPLLNAMAKTGKPVIISTGMSNENEIRNAVGIFSGTGTDISLMHCVSLYPTDGREANLGRISSLRSAFNLEVGLSDHSSSIINPIIAASLGSMIFEKHFILNESHECPDYAVSVTPAQFRKMTVTVNDVIERLGDGEIYKPSREDDVARAARRSIFASTDIKKGELLTADKLKFQRPGTGIPVNMLDEILGKRVNRDIKNNSIIRNSFLS